MTDEPTMPSREHRQKLILRYLRAEALAEGNPPLDTHVGVNRKVLRALLHVMDAADYMVASPMRKDHIGERKHYLKAKIEMAERAMKDALYD